MGMNSKLAGNLRPVALGCNEEDFK